LYIIIVGGGQHGYHLAKALLSEGHEVLVIEQDSRKVRRIEEELGGICIQGDGCEVATLAEAGAERANLLVALTGKDEDNLVACQVGKNKFNIPRTMSRLSNPKNDALFMKLGIDTTISSVNLILEHIEEEIPTHPLTHLMAFGSGELEVIEVKIPADSPAVGKCVSDVGLPPGSVISLIIRDDDEAQVPAPDTILQADDRLIAVTRPDLEEPLREALVTG
jgi:trk system potassium uptake protein TrkA